MNPNLRSTVARVVYEVWKAQGQPHSISAHDVLAEYRLRYGEITPKSMAEALAVIEDEDAPFIRMQVPDMGGELGRVALRDIYEDRLFSIASGANESDL